MKEQEFLIKFHYLLEKKQMGLFELSKVITKDQLADVFTKALPKELFRKLRDWMGVIEDKEVLNKTNEDEKLCYMLY